MNPRNTNGLTSIDDDALRRMVRLLMLIDGSERAGIAPIRLRLLHTYAYLSNVLAPVWHQHVFDGRLLKQQDGPFYPALQNDLDRLIGLGLVTIEGVSHNVLADGRYRLDGTFKINHELAGTALEVLVEHPEELTIRSFLLELAYALSALTTAEFELLPTEDPTYSDPIVTFENVLDFAEWRNLNYSANATRYFESVSESISPGELLHMYVRHLRGRIGGLRRHE